MKYNDSLHTLLAAAVLLCGLESCDFVYDYARCVSDRSVEIVNDWSAAPGASPAGMAFVFFKAGERVPWRFDFPGIRAGEVKLPAGSYGFLSYNDDTDSVFFDESTFDAYAAFTRADSLPPPFVSDEPVVESPDMLWGCSISRVEVAESGKNVVVAPQRPVTATYDWTIAGVENLGGVRAMSAALSGMSGSYVFSGRDSVRYPVTQTFKAVSVDKAAVGGRFYSFGIPDRPAFPNILRLFVRLADGRRFEYRFDVTDQVRGAPDPMMVSLLVSGLRIEPSDTVAEGGFDVAVDGWKTVVVNIND